MTGYSFDKKPLAFWMVQMLSEELTERQAAAHAIDSMTGEDLEPFSAEVRRVMRDDETASFGMSSDDFVNRLLAMYILHGNLWQEYWNSIRKDDDAFVDQWIAKHGEAPEQLARLMRRICLRSARREREQPFDLMPGVCLLFLVGSLGKEFLPASDMLRWMLHEREHCGIATDIVHRMGEAGEQFFEDFLEIARIDFCALWNYSRYIGDMIRHSSEKIERLLKLVDDPNLLLSLYAVAALGSCGPAAERLVPETEDRLLRLSEESFDRLYGEHAVPIDDRKQRNALEKIFSHSTMSLGAVSTSEKTLRHFTDILDTDLPRKPLTGTYSTERNEYDWEFNVAPFHLVRGTIISSLKYFSSFPETVVPRLVSLLTEFEEYDSDTWPYARVLDAIAVYARFGSEEAKQESQSYDYSSDEEEYLFQNRFEPYFSGLTEVLGDLLWMRYDRNDETDQPELNDRIVQMLGRFGRTSQTQLPLLEDVKTTLIKRYGKKFVSVHGF